jgi:hypothetical protein
VILAFVVGVLVGAVAALVFCLWTVALVIKGTGARLVDKLHKLVVAADALRVQLRPPAPPVEEKKRGVGCFES